MKVICYHVPWQAEVLVRSMAPSFVNSHSSEDEAITDTISTLPREATNVLVIEDSQLPSDDGFRAAWRVREGAVVEDEQQCREITEKNLQAKKLDKARELLEREMMGENIASERAALRAFDPQAIVVGKTPQQLRAQDMANPSALRRQPR